MMPQLDVSTYSSQIFWLIVSLLPIYLILNFSFLPKFKSIIDIRIKNTIEARKEIAKMEQEISQINSEIKKKMHDSFCDIKDRKVRCILEMELEVYDKNKELDRKLTEMRKDFITQTEKIKSDASPRVDASVIEYSCVIINKLLSINPDKEVLLSIYNGNSYD